MKINSKVLFISISIILFNNLIAGCKTGPAKNLDKKGFCDIKNNHQDCKKGYSCMYTGKGPKGSSCVKCSGKECDNDSDCVKTNKGNVCYSGKCKSFYTGLNK